MNNAAVRGEWVYGSRVNRTDGALVYAHEAGFVAGSARSFRGVVSRLSHATARPVLSLDYRLAPEHDFPAAQEDVAAAYDWLLGLGTTPHQVIIAGDAAGGFLAADMVVRNARAGRAPPEALLFFSPMTDLALELPAHFPGAAGDGLLLMELAQRAVAGASTNHATCVPIPVSGCLRR